jgi:hypothetical protein
VATRPLSGEGDTVTIQMVGVALVRSGPCGRLLLECDRPATGAVRQNAAPEFGREHASVPVAVGSRIRGRSLARSR